MPRLVRLFIRQALIGYALSAVFVAALLFFNIANLWHLVSTSDIGLIAVFILFYCNGVVFAGVQFAITVMGMAEKEQKPGGGRRIRLPMPPAGELEPIRVPSRSNASRV